MNLAAALRCHEAKSPAEAAYYASCMHTDGAPKRWEELPERSREQWELVALAVTARVSPRLLPLWRGIERAIERALGRYPEAAKAVTLELSKEPFRGFAEIMGQVG